jgi:aspartate aminotransferase
MPVPAAASFPPGVPDHVRRAHLQIGPIFEFLRNYDRWIAAARPDACDFALGNPQSMPLQPFVRALRDATEPRNPTWYAYKTNEAASRETIVRSLRTLTGVAYPPENIFLTNGATGALLVTLNALLGHGDEAVFQNPPWFFYEGMILRSGGTPVAVDVRPDTFDLDVEAIARAITPRTRLVIVNSPNNPTGKVYGAATLEALGRALEEASRRVGHPVLLVSDEAYRAVVYDGASFRSPTTFYRNSIMIYTYGKTLLTPGQRLGYIALSPGLDHLASWRDVIYSTQILSGWAMASALMQHSLPDLEKIALDVAALERRRDRFVQGLRDAGYEVRSPEGAFYITPRAPLDDDVAFCNSLAEEGVFCLPGSVVKMRGYFRASLTGNDEMVERSLPRFAAARARARSLAGR